MPDTPASRNNDQEAMNPDLRQELSDRLDRLVYLLGRQARGHYLASKSAERWDSRLGIALIVTTALTTTGVVATALEDGSRTLAIVSAALAATSTILSGMKKAGNYSEQATKFLAAATRYERLKSDARKMQFDVAQLEPAAIDSGSKRLHELEIRRAAATAEVPDLKDHFYDTAVSEGNKQNQKPDEER